MPKKSSVAQASEKKSSHENIQEKLIENFVALQKVHTNLAEKLDKLSNQISELLGLFEKAARTFSENPVNQSSEKDKEFLEKINTLMDQNKTIAKGLTLMEERIRERVYGHEEEKPAPINEDMDVPVTPKPLPKF